MKTAKKLLAVLLALCLLGAMATVLSACGDEKEDSKSEKNSSSEKEDPKSEKEDPKSEKKDSNSPEGFVESYFKAISNRDAEKMVDIAFAKPMLEYYEDEYDMGKDDFIENFDEEFENYDDEYGDNWKIKDLEIEEVNDMNDDDFEDLQEYFEDTFDMKITDAKQMDVSYTIKGEDNEEEDEEEFTVFKYDGKWYLYG